MQNSRRYAHAIFICTFPPEYYGIVIQRSRTFVSIGSGNGLAPNRPTIGYKSFDIIVDMSSFIKRLILCSDVIHLSHYKPL